MLATGEVAEETLAGPGCIFVHPSQMGLIGCENGGGRSIEVGGHCWLLSFLVDCFEINNQPGLRSS